jgi:hypothetical protein
MLSVKIVAIKFIPTTLTEAMAVTIAKIVMQSYHSVRTAKNEIARLSCQLFTADTDSKNGAKAVRKTMLGIVTDVMNRIAITTARIIYEA